MPFRTDSEVTSFDVSTSLVSLCFAWLILALHYSKNSFKNQHLQSYFTCGEMCQTSWSIKSKWFGNEDIFMFICFWVSITLLE